MRALVLAAFVILGSGGGGSVAPPVGTAVGSLTFTGDNTGDDGRAKINRDGGAGNPINIGAGDFTVEMWLRPTMDNTAVAQATGNTDDWTISNIFFDGDVFGTQNSFGFALADGRPMFGVQDAGVERELVATSADLRDGSSHHVSFMRDESAGNLYIHVDGTLYTTTGPAGDISLPNGHSSAWPNDNYLVMGTEKHDLGVPYYGEISELRISSTLRYSTAGSLTVPTAALTVDGDTIALYHFGEGSGTTVGDESANNLDWTITLNAMSEPTWSADDPF